MKNAESRINYPDIHPFNIVISRDAYRERELLPGVRLRGMARKGAQKEEEFQENLFSSLDEMK